jgi:hypothetical protein
VLAGKSGLGKIADPGGIQDFPDLALGAAGTWDENWNVEKLFARTERGDDLERKDTHRFDTSVMLKKRPPRR